MSKKDEIKRPGDEGVDRFATGQGEPPTDVAGLSGGNDIDADGNAAFHGEDVPAAKGPETDGDEEARPAYDESTTPVAGHLP